jgi:hypothetical protein
MQDDVDNDAPRPVRYIEVSSDIVRHEHFRPFCKFNFAWQSCSRRFSRLFAANKSKLFLQRQRSAANGVLCSTYE